MAVPSLSTEGRMLERLRVLQCVEMNFAKLVAGIISRPRLRDAFREPTRCLDTNLADKLIEKITQMEELQQAVAPIPVDWTRVEEVKDALAIRLAAQVESEKGNHELDNAASWATVKVSKQ